MSLQCAASVLATMPRPSLEALKGSITTIRNGVALVKTKKEAALASLEVVLTPLQLARGELAKTVKSITDSTQLVPQDAVAKCPELGQLNYTISQVAATPASAVSNLLFDIERLLASKLAIKAEIQSLDTSIQFFDDMLVAIDQALASAV